MEVPRMVPIKYGWAAVGDGWAIFAASRSEAQRDYEEAALKHQEITTRHELTHIDATDSVAQDGRLEPRRDGRSV